MHNCAIDICEICCDYNTFTIPLKKLYYIKLATYISFLTPYVEYRTVGLQNYNL